MICVNHCPPDDLAPPRHNAEMISSKETLRRRRIPQQHDSSGGRQLHLERGNIGNRAQHQPFVEIGFAIDTGKAEELPSPPDVEQSSFIHSRNSFLTFFTRSINYRRLHEISSGIPGINM